MVESNEQNVFRSFTTLARLFVNFPESVDKLDCF